MVFMMRKFLFQILSFKRPECETILEKAGREKDSVSTMFPRTWNEDRLKLNWPFHKKGNIVNCFIHVRDNNDSSNLAIMILLAG